MLWSSGYRELVPPRALGGALACLWVRVAPAHEPSPTLVLPDACVDLIWSHGRGAFIAGPDTGPAPVQMEPGSVLVGARFRPGAGGPALGLPLREFLNARVDLRDVRRDLADVLPATLTPSAALREVAATAGRMVAKGPPDPLVRGAARRLARPGIVVETLARELDISERQLRRRFQDAVGYGPKTLQRVLRFQNFLGRLDVAGPGADLAGIAGDAGYADQAHLTRESTRLSGLPPAALARRRLSD